MLLANWPYTLPTIMPVNRRLDAIPPDRAGPETRGLVLRRGRLHAVRGALGTGAVLACVWALHRSGRG